MISRKQYRDWRNDVYGHTEKDRLKLVIRIKRLKIKNGQEGEQWSPIRKKREVRKNNFDSAFLFRVEMCHYRFKESVLNLSANCTDRGRFFRVYKKRKDVRCLTRSSDTRKSFASFNAIHHNPSQPFFCSVAPCIHPSIRACQARGAPQPRSGWRNRVAQQGGATT
jgi:hypothetical protein